MDVVDDRGSKGEDGMGQRDQVMHDEIPHVRGLERDGRHKSHPESPLRSVIQSTFLRLTSLRTVFSRQWSYATSRD